MCREQRHADKDLGQDGLGRTGWEARQQIQNFLLGNLAIKCRERVVASWGVVGYVTCKFQFLAPDPQSSCRID